jgi:superfamily II DNA or RNA helicase
LGLTATPTYSNKYKYGWLEKLFPQRILDQVTAQQLMADDILSKPEIEQNKLTLRLLILKQKNIRNGLKITKIYRNT